MSTLNKGVCWQNLQKNTETLSFICTCTLNGVRINWTFEIEEKRVFYVKGRI